MTTCGLVLVTMAPRYLVRFVEPWLCTNDVCLHTQARNADQEIELDDSEDVHMDHVPDARKAYAMRVDVPAENAEAAPMDVDSPSTVALKRKGREYDPEDEAPETEAPQPAAEEEEEEAPKPKSKKHKKTAESAAEPAKPAKGKSAFAFARNKAAV